MWVKFLNVQSANSTVQWLLIVSSYFPNNFTCKIFIICISYYLINNQRSDGMRLIHTYDSFGRQGINFNVFLICKFMNSWLFFFGVLLIICIFVKLSILWEFFLASRIIFLSLFLLFYTLFIGRVIFMWSLFIPCFVKF